jgi:hypothetical protein
MSFSGGSPSCRLKQVGVPRIDKSVCNIYYAGAIRFESKKLLFSSPLMPKQARSLFHGKPIQTFGIKKCSTWVGYVSTTNVWLGCISLLGTKQLNLFCLSLHYKEKSFYNTNTCSECYKSLFLHQ